MRLKVWFSKYNISSCPFSRKSQEFEQLEIQRTYEPPHDKTNKMASAPSDDSDQPGHPPSLIRVFAVHLMGS